MAQMGQFQQMPGPPRMLYPADHLTRKRLFNAGTEMETNEMTSSQRPGAL